jgi:hypothetical protein
VYQFKNKTITPAFDARDDDAKIGEMKTLKALFRPF